MTVHYNQHGKPLCGSEEPHPELGGLISCETCIGLVTAMYVGGEK